MAAPGLSARPPQKPSRLPLHRSRPSADKSSPTLPSPSPVFHAENSHTSVFSDAGKRSDHLSSESRSSHKTTQVRLNRMSLQGQQGVADEVSPRRRSHPQTQSRVRDVTVIGVVGISSAAATAQNHLVNGDVINDTKSTVRLSGSPSCGVRMSALRSAGREQQSSPTFSSTSSDRHASAARLRHQVTVGVQHEPRDTALLHRVSTSSVDSTYSDHLQRQAPAVVPRRLARLSTSSSASDDSGNRQHNGCGSRASRCRPKYNNVSGECDEVMTTSGSGCLGPPILRHLPAACPQIDKLQLHRRSDGYFSTSGICMPTDVRSTEHRQRPAAAIVEPQRRYYHLWRLSETDVDDFSVAGSMSTIMSIDSSFSSSKSSSGTLTDDADESTDDESTTTSDRDKQLQNRRTSDVSSAGPALIMHAQPPPHRDSITPGHKMRTKLPSRCTSHASSSSSSELPSPPPATSIVGSQRPAKNILEDTRQQRIGNFGIKPRVPVTFGKHITTSPSASPGKFASSSRNGANRPKNLPVSASATDELPTGSRTNAPSSHGRLPSESKTAVARHVAHSSSPAAAVGRRQQTAFADSSSMQLNHSPVVRSSAVKTPNSPPHAYVPTRQTAAVKKAASAAGVSKSKLSISHIPVSLPSNVAVQMPPQRASSIANVRAASKISSALRDTRRTGSNAGIRANVVDEDSTSVNNGHELVDESVGKTKMGMMTPRGAQKPFTAVKQVGSSQRETVHSRDNSHQAKTVRDMPTPATRSSKTQPSSTVATSRNDPMAVTKRPPPPPPSKIKKLGFVSDRRRASVTEQRRPASMDFTAVGSVRQQSVGDFGKKSDSCSNVANLSTSTEQPMSTRKPAKGTLNKNAQLAKSYDSIMPFSSDSKMKNSDTVCSQMNGSSMSLVDMPPRKLMKPYSVINRCSNFGRKMTPLKVVHSTTLDCNEETETQNVAASSRSSLASQARASELSDLPEVDEFECDCHISSLGRLSADEGDRGRDGGRSQSPVERTEAMEFSSICPSIQQKSTDSYKYRAEYSTFLSAFPPKDDKLIVETAHVASNISLSHQNCISVMIKQDKHDMEDRVQLSDYGEPDNKSSISATRLITLSAEIPIVKDATDEAADKPSSSGNYVVTYESDNIVVLDREPVIDCLTPEGDVVSTEVCKRLTVPVGTAPGESGLSRTLPLSESGYDTWKSSQGSVIVATGSTCVVAPDVSAEQHQEHEQDGTLRSCECNHLKSFDMQSQQEKNIETEGRENCRPEKGSDLSELFKDGDNLYGESTTKTVAGAAAAAEVNERHGESASLDDDSGRVADSSVEDYALGDAQMFSSICSDVVEPFVGGTSCSAISRYSRPSPSPADNAVSGLVDPIDICFSSPTMPSSDSDILSTFLSSPINAAHLEHFEEQVDNASWLLPGMGRSRRHVDVEMSGVPDNSADGDIRLDPAVISTRKMAGFDAGEDHVTDVKQSDEYRGHISKVSHFTLADGNGGYVGPSSAVVTAAVSDSTSLDPYETICDDLLESVEANISDSETSHPSCQPAAPFSTDVGRQPDDKLLEQRLTPVNDHDTTAVVVSNGGVEWQSINRGVSTLNNGSSAVTTAMTGRLPAMTLRRVRTNFSVVYRHTTSQSTASQSRQSSAHGGHVEAKADTRQTPSHGVDQQSGAVGCRRALAVLASRIDDHGRRRLPATNVDKRVISKQTLQSAAVHHDADVAADSSAISLSSMVKPITSSSTVTSYNGATAASVNLQSTQSPLNVHDVAPVKAESKLPTTSHDSVPKKPSTFRKLLSSKLTNVVRRTQTNKTRTSSLS